MPDRSLRLLTLTPRPRGATRGALVLRERPSSPPDAAPEGRQSGDGQDDNPFAAPPEGAPDRPWQPRHPAAGRDDDRRGGDGDHGDRGAGAPDDDDSPWGRQWSDRQPGRSSDGFGQRPGSGPEGQPGRPGPNMRWDPTDPIQRRARYALLGGMWAFFFALFSWTYLALLLGALALYWGISALRAKPRRPDPDRPEPEPAASRPQTTAAVSGLVTASLALLLVAITFTAQLVYRDYYTCTSDALTDAAKQSCSKLLPEELRGVLGTNG
ncbi:hypothetical protein ACL02U_10825 [Streptomyces sp. MS06]|uniref:hypothetical protein n=1 Tax=Streptomyces sp. MS06 TaxID=3385974 RepID=UPI00399F1CB6